jgi:flagellar biosynthesis protein
MKTEYYRINPDTRKNENGQKPLQATALGYEPGKDVAPRVLATGKGAVAEKIITLAQENNIPIREDPVLAAALATVDLNETIPPELYKVVAEILAYVYRIRLKYQKTNFQNNG